MAAINILDYPVYINPADCVSGLLEGAKTVNAFFTDNFYNHPLLAVVRPRGIWRFLGTKMAALMGVRHG